MAAALVDAWVSLGKLTVAAAGTVVRLTTNQTDPTARLSVHSILIQAWPTNGGKVYILSSPTGDRTTGVDVLAILAVPATNIIPSASATVTYAPAAINAASYWIDADENGDAVLASFIQA